MIASGYDLTAFESLGERLGHELPPGSVVWLEGELGAGKTTLVRAMVRGRGVAEPASSPTYNLVHHYRGPRGSVYHVDCYRLRDPEQAADLDWETLAGADLLLIEWPRRAAAWAPPPSTVIRIDVADAERRRVVVE